MIYIAGDKYRNKIRWVIKSLFKNLAFLFFCELGKKLLSFEIKQPGLLKRNSVRTKK